MLCVFEKINGRRR